jgi:tripartite-type tricarboxylate transporter receptor subunit TctC
MMMRGGLLALLLAFAAGSALADGFYKGKTITIVTSTGVGGSYDGIARLVARFMPRHIPDQPNMVVQNMPGGGNVIATNYMYNIAPKDGTVVATINNGIPLHQVIDDRGVRYDSDKFNWLGSTGAINAVTIAWHTAGVKTIQDVFSHELILGGTGPASAIVIFPEAMNNVLGTKFKIVNGYKSSAEVYLAMEKGETNARSGGYADLVSEHGDWIRDKKIVFLVQIGEKREPTLPDVPLMTELAKTDEQRQILTLISSPMALGQPYLASPGVPADRVEILRQGLMDTFRDKEFLAETDKIHFDIRAMTGQEVARIVHDTVAAPREIVAKARAAMGETAAAQ